jgi:hypothetical protein
MAWFRSKVEVTLIDDATGVSIGVTQLPPDALPETFELDTTLHLGDEDWSVVDAQPPTRAQYAKSKTLTLRLRRIEKIDPSKILFGLPSICDFIPPVNDQPLAGGEFVLAEDDWRQFEFVSRELANVVDEEIARIRRIHETAAAEVGWREIHVRSRPERPLLCTITFAELSECLNVPTRHGVTYQGAQTQVADGYSLTTADGMSVYGVAPNGNIQVIALAQYSESSPNVESVESIARLRTLARDFNLDLVYWCRCARVSPDHPLFESLLSNNAK